MSVYNSYIILLYIGFYEGYIINYKHLRYFWMVAKEGSIAKASKLLFLTPQTISGQLTVLEENLGISLFEKSGRSLKLTDAGLIVQSYANDIFSLGNELEEVLHNKPQKRLVHLKAGIANSIPKSIAYHLLEPVLHLKEPIKIICREDNLSTLLGELAEHKLDIVISDRAIPESPSINGFNHHLGECGITFFCTGELRENLQGEFPACLDNMPLLLTGDASSTKNNVVQWLKQQSIFPHIIAEFDDGALMKAFGQRGAGIFIAPSIIAKEVEIAFGVKSIGETTKVMESFYAISMDRKVKHSGVVTILNNAREQFFSIADT